MLTKVWPKTFEQLTVIKGSKNKPDIVRPEEAGFVLPTMTSVTLTILYKPQNIDPLSAT